MPIFPQNVVAIIWDFDKTLTPGYMQEPLFRHYGVPSAEFWAEVEGLDEFYRRRGADLVAEGSLYLNHILTYVRAGVFPGLSNKLLRRLGAEIEFYPGLPGFFEQVRKAVTSVRRFGEHDIEVEHYVVSSGLRQMILGSELAPYVDGVWACEFAEEVPRPGYLAADDGQLTFTDPEEPEEIQEVLYTIDNTSKTRAVFEINKGSNKAEIDVNAKVDEADRRVPFANMLYIADGPSDIPVFSVVRRYGGQTYAVYQPGSTAQFHQVNRLQSQGRVHAIGPADYREGSHTYMWITSTVEAMAERIATMREQAIADRLGQPPRHLDDEG